MNTTKVAVAVLLATLAAAAEHAQTNGPQANQAPPAAPPNTAQPVDPAACATKATAAKNNYLYSVPKKQKSRLRLLGIPTPEAKLANEVEKTTFASCMAGPNPVPGGGSAPLVTSTGSIAKEYDDGGKHHAVIMMDNQVILTTPVSVPGGTDSKVLFTDEQKRRYFFWDLNDNNAVKEVVPVQGTMATFTSVGKTFTVILQSTGVADLYPLPPLAPPRPAPSLLRQGEDQKKETGGASPPAPK